jgi:geranylgeranyl reductase family protein
MSRMDIAIVGAGPAGAWTAWQLARQGARVTIFDASHPREKPCGGGVTGRALALIAGAVPPGELPAVPIGRARFETMSGLRAEVGLRDAGSSADSDLVVVDRASFDRRLLEAACGAGAKHEAVRVRDVRVERDGVALDLGTHAVRAPLVVGADGANSLVRRRMARAFDRRQLSIATGFFVRGASAREIDVAFLSDPPGYLWSFPRRDHLAIGCGAQADVTTSERLRAIVRHWIDARGLSRGASLEPYSWPIPSLDAAGLSAERAAGARWLLVGDAAGLVDPITREGIYFALQSGTLAARAVLGGGDIAAAYRAALGDDIYPELERAARLKAGFFRGPFVRLVVHALGRSSGVRSVMADLVAGRQPYRTLRRRLLSTFEARLAWQFLRQAGQKA